MPRPEQPIQHVHEELTSFAAGLRELREQAGTPTYRRLADLSGYSVTALSQAAAGRKLPSLAVTLAFAAACGGAAAEWETRWRSVSDTLSGDQTPEPEAPYVGLTCFEVDDADRFFGRETVADEVLVAIGKHRLVGVFGASGVGKSSLLRAGLLARLEREAVLFTPGANPVDECVVQVARLTGRPTGEIRTEFGADPDALRRSLAGRDLVLVVDQFEEVFSLCADQAERDWFIEALVLAAGEVHVVLGTRADFYGHCGQYPRLVAALRDAQVLVGPMSADELREAITRPAVRAGCTVETALVARLIAEVAGEPGALPLLSHALLQTWRRRNGMTLTLAGYEQAGGIEHALARTAEQVYGGFDEIQQERARHLFLRMTALGEGTEDTKRRVLRRELDPDPHLEAVVDALATARLVSVGEDRIDVAHEALIRHWPRLRDWLHDDREGLRIHRHLMQATDDWEAVQRDSGALYRGVRLAAARDWVAGNEAATTAREQAFLRASHHAAQRRTRRLQQVIVVLNALLLVAGVSVVLAVRGQQIATEQRNLAVAGNIINRAAELEKTNPTLAVQLKLAAYRTAVTPETTTALLNAFASPYASRFDVPAGHGSGMAFMRDRTVMALLGDDGVIRFWDTSRPDRIRPLASLDGFGRAGFMTLSPDGRVMVAMGDDRIPWLWKIDDLNHPVRVMQLAADSTGVFSLDGRLLALHRVETIDALHAVGRIELWNIEDPARPTRRGVLAGDKATFSPDGRLLAAGTPAGGLLWDISDPGLPRPLEPLPVSDRWAECVGCVFSPDSKILAAREGDWTLWDLTDPTHRRKLATLKGGMALAFSPDGRTIATGDGSQAGRTVLLWDISDRTKPRQTHSIDYLPDSIEDLEFSADGRWIMSLTHGSIVALDRAGLPLSSIAGAMTSAAFAGDGRTLLLGEQGRTARLWNIADVRHPQEMSTLLPSRPDDGTAVVSAAMPDGHSIALGIGHVGAQVWDVTAPEHARQTAALELEGDLRAVSNRGVAAVSVIGDGRLGAEHTMQLWDIGHSVKLGTLTVQSGIDSAAFAHHVPLLATVSGAGSTELWDIGDVRRPAHLTTLPLRGVLAAINSKDQLLTADSNGAVRLWSLTDPRHPAPLTTLSSGASGVTALAFSPDGHLAAIGGKDGKTALWSIADPSKPRQLATLAGHTQEITDVRFGSDGVLATTSWDGTARMWETDPARAAAEICRSVPPMTTEAWTISIPELPFAPTCP